VARMTFERGSSPSAVLFRSGMTYKTFSHNFLMLFGRMIASIYRGGDRVNDAQAAMWLILAPSIMAGGGALVVKPLLVATAKAVAAGLGLPPPDDPEEEFYRWMGDSFGETPERAARSGLAGLAGVNLKGSLAIGVTDLPTTLKELLGAPYSFFEDIGKAGASFAREDYLKGAEKIVPRAVKGIIQGVRESRQGVTTRNNQPVYYGNERVKPSRYDIILRMLQFNPAGISEKREQQWKDTMVERKYAEIKSDINARIRRVANSGTTTKEEWTEILLDVEKYNARVRASKFKSMPFIRPSGIKAILTKMEKPGRRERIRAGEATNDDPGTITPESLTRGASTRGGRSSSRRSTRRSSRR